MQFDDRLATVLRTRADSDAVLRTQFRQLLDLLGSRKEAWPGAALDRLVGQATALETQEAERLILRPALHRENSRLATLAAYVRLARLRERLPQEVQSQILREPGLRLRNAQLVGFLAQGAPKPSASAMATARLREAEWLELIPRLPVTARGFLRHRRDLSPAVRDLLAKLGVSDLVLPEPDSARSERMAITEAPEAVAAPIPVPLPANTPVGEGIGTLLRRIEAFREQRRSQPLAPRLPLEDQAQPRQLATVEFATDAEGMVIWASEVVAPLLVGLSLAAPRPGPLVTVDPRTASSIAARQLVHAAPLILDAAPEISGEWRFDAAPLFDPQTGAFTGYRGCLRRPVASVAVEVDSEADVMRQVLHELRTPVNAIQGFAEIIQQQLFGPAPHQYRAHAAAISVDSAKLLAGFDEVDRLVRLEGGAMELDQGEADLHAAIAATVERLQGVLRPRAAGFSLSVSGGPFVIPLDRGEAMSLCWRLLATAAAAMAPGEATDLLLSGDGETIRLELDAPRALTESGPADTARDGRQSAVKAGMFGPAFTFRLAQAEAKAAGGELICKINRVTLVLPALTAIAGDPSAGTGRMGK